MAFDQNSIPQDLRPLNVARSIAEEPRIAPAPAASASTVRNIEGFFPNPPLEAGSPGSIPVFYPAGTVSEAGFFGLGYGNGALGVAMWGPRMPVTSVGHPGAVGFGFGYNPNLGNRVGGNAVDLASGAMVATGTGYSVNLGNRVGGNGADQVGGDMATGNGYNVNLTNRVGGSGVDQVGSDMATGFGYNPNLGSRISGNANDHTGNSLAAGYGYSSNLGNRGAGSGADQVSDEGGDDSVSGKKVKFLCSFGGKILPRPSDGMLRYVGGQTRIISVRRDVSFSELMQKMVDTYGQPVAIKYQLPDEDLDALVSVSCPEDLDNMMDEFEKLVERSSDGSKLRLFLFSASELDPSGIVQLGDLLDSGQRYVDAVNGLTDGVGGGIKRKGSMASASSTQNSDFSGTEAVDSLGPGQGDVNGPSSTGMLSPRGNLATSNDTAPRLMCVDPNPAVYTDASSVPLGIPVVKSGPPQTSSSQPEVELERSVPITVSQLQLGLQQTGMDIPTSGTYLQAYVDPHQEVKKHADYLQPPPQMGFPNHQLLGTSGSLYTQQHFHDGAGGITPHQYVPAVHMTMTPASSHVSIRPNMIQPMVQPQQTRLDHYADETKFGPRVVQVPVEQSYNTYQVQAPSATVGYGWHQVPVPEHVIFSDRLGPHQQDQRDSGASCVSNSNSIHHSLRLEENMRAQPMNRVMVTGALGEGIVDQKVGAQPMVLGQVDTQVGITQSDTTAFTQSLETQNENERTILQKADDLDKPRISAPLSVIGRAGDVQSSYAAFIGTAPQSYLDDAVQQHSVPAQYQVKKDALANKPINGDIASAAGAPVQNSERIFQESPKEYPNKHPGILPKEDTADTYFSYDQLRPIDGRMDSLRISPSETYNNEHSKAPLDKIRKEDSFDHKPQQVTGKEVLLDNTCGKPKLVFETNHNKPSEGMPCPSTEVSYVHSSQALESYEVVQPAIWANPESYSQSNVGIHNFDPEEIHYGNPVLSGVESSHLTDRISAPAELKDDTSRIQPKMVPVGAEAFPSSNNTLSSLSPSGRTGDVQDSSSSLFSNQDPWTLRHDTYFPPPRPNKVLPKKEAFANRDPFGESRLGNTGELNTEVRLEDGLHQSLGNQNKDFHSEHSRSSKGSAEEQIKQDLQAVAEGVAATVLHSATSSNPDLHDRNESEAIQDGDNQNSSVDMQRKAKAEDVKNKLPDKAHLGFPVSDGIGRLQIIKNSDLEELRELGSGTFGTVYHGKWRGTDVAIKRINDRCFAGKPSEQERMRDDFWNEAIKLADLHHPNVLAFYGVVLDGPGGSVATVTEYMVNGSLRNALQKNEKNLDKRKRLLIAMDVAFGMEYLHAKNIVHFDLKSDNLLVNLRDSHRPICKVGDLGLSKVKCQTLISGGVRGTLPWMAPELLNGSSSLVSEKVDVFSFGIVLWELLTGEEPYADLHYGAIIGGIVSNTLRPPIPESCDSDWRSLMEKCWSAEPSERPSFTEIANELRSMEAKLPPKGQNQQQQLPPSTQSQVQK
ncbi:RAF-like serine/threonine-protein kinase 24 isoform X2 [Castanea sativa]|uniref:RAF-like serine/threonine-protein kinase 24 isoform X2 n=1 Tax=Castanea sativa TaxID=21020 RepID=UPI003F651759